MAAILEMPQYVAYQKTVAFAFMKLSAKSHSFNILCTMDGLSCDHAVTLACPIHPDVLNADKVFEVVTHLTKVPSSNHYEVICVEYCDYCVILANGYENKLDLCTTVSWP